jgi:adenosine deaminase
MSQGGKLDRELIASLPKIELHLHLDCSLSFDVVKQLRPDISETEYEQNFIAPEKSKDLAETLKGTSRVKELMQTEEALGAVVKDLFVQLQRDHVIYAEIRFAPLNHLEKGLSPEEVVEIVAESVKERIHSTGIKAGIILCTVRRYDEEQSLQTIKLVERYFKHSHVVGFDIASDEAGYPIDSHKKAFEYAINKDIPRTAHAGEAKGPESVWETLTHFKPQRIGHGVRSIEDEDLIEFLIKNNIHLEVCPTANIVVNVFENYSDHPIDDLYKAGVSVGVNSDGRTLLNVNLTKEYMKLAKVFDWRIDHFYNCNRNSLEHAFISNSEKEELRSFLSSSYSPYLSQNAA